MIRTPTARPSLKVSGDSATTPASRFVFEVWNPFARAYQPIDTMDEGLRRVRELAALICRMVLLRHPKLMLLADVPEVDMRVGERWAEVRITATTYRSYDTRRDDRPRWAPAMGLAQATEAIRTRVGYAPGVS